MKSGFTLLFYCFDLVFKWEGIYLAPKIIISYTLKVGPPPKKVPTFGNKVGLLVGP